MYVELVAATLKEMQLLPEEVNSTNILPKDFASATYKNFYHFRYRFWLQLEDFELEREGKLLPEFRIILNENTFLGNISKKLSLSPQLKKKLQDPSTCLSEMKAVLQNSGLWEEAEENEEEIAVEKSQ